MASRWAISWGLQLYSWLFSSILVDASEVSSNHRIKFILFILTKFSHSILCWIIWCCNPGCEDLEEDNLRAVDDYNLRAVDDLKDKALKRRPVNKNVNHGILENAKNRSKPMFATGGNNVTLQLNSKKKIETSEILMKWVIWTLEHQMGKNWTIPKAPISKANLKMRHNSFKLSTFGGTSTQ